MFSGVVDFPVVRFLVEDTVQADVFNFFCTLGLLAGLISFQFRIVVRVFRI